MLLRNSANYLLARGVPGLLNFAALLIYTRLLTPDDYGRYALVIAGVSLAGVLVFQWQRLVLARWLSARKTEPQRFLGEMLRLFVQLALAASIIGAVTALLWPDPVWQRLLLLSVLLFGAQGWVDLNLVLAAAQFAPARYGRILGAKTLVALLVGAGLAWLGLGAYAPLLGLLVGCVLPVPLFGLGVWRGARLARPEQAVLREQLRYGLPLIVTFALGWIIASSDRLLIGWLLDAEAIGQYAVGYDLAQQSLGTLLVVVQLAAYPLAVTALEDRGVVAATLQIRQNGELILGIALAGAAGIAVLAPQLAAVLVGHEFRVATASLLPWIALGAAIGGIKAFYFDQAFHLARNSRGQLVSGAVAALANVGLNLLLIPRFGIQGAAYATVAAYLLGLAFSAWLGRRVFPLPPALPLLRRTGSVALAVAAGAAAGGMLGTGLVGLLAGVLGGALAALTLAFRIDLAKLRTGSRQWWQARSVSWDVDWQKPGLRSVLKSALRILLARMGEGIADPHLVVEASRQPEALALYLPSLRGGGAERVMVTLANGFAARGLQVDLVLARAEGPYLAEVSPAVRVVDLGASRVLASLPGLVRYLRRERPTALLSAMSHANIVAAGARRLARVPTRLVVAEHTHLSVSSANARTLRGRSLVHGMRWAYPGTDDIVAVSSGVAVDLAASIGVPRERVQVIHNPVVTAAMLASSRQPLGHPWFGPEQPPVLLSVGRLTAAKDFPLLLRAFAQLRAQRDLRLMILGEGELRPELEALVRELRLEEAVALPGFVHNPYAYMRRAALYVLSSGWEGFGNVLAEAMACGTPVVATDCPSGPAEILEDGRWGRLVPVGDVDALAHAMAATLDEAVHPDSATRAADFGVDQAVTNYLRVLLPDGAFDTDSSCSTKRTDVVPRFDDILDLD